jgi:hypothetical protein
LLPSQKACKECQEKRRSWGGPTTLRQYKERKRNEEEERKEEAERKRNFGRRRSSRRSFKGISVNDFAALVLREKTWRKSWLVSSGQGLK